MSAEWKFYGSRHPYKATDFHLIHGVRFPWAEAVLDPPKDLKDKAREGRGEGDSQNMKKVLKRRARV